MTAAPAPKVDDAAAAQKAREAEQREAQRLADEAKRQEQAERTEAVDAARKYSWIYDDSRIRSELGFVPEYDLAGAIRRTVAWYAERGLARIR